MTDEELKFKVQLELDDPSVRGIERRLSQSIEHVRAGHSIKPEAYAEAQLGAEQLQAVRASLEADLQQIQQKLSAHERNLRERESELKQLRKDAPGREPVQQALQEEKQAIRSLSKEQAAGTKHLDTLNQLLGRFAGNEPRFKEAMSKSTEEGIEKGLRRVLNYTMAQGMRATGAGALADVGLSGNSIIGGSFMDKIIQGVSKHPVVAGVMAAGIATVGLAMARIAVIGRSTRSLLPMQFSDPNAARALESSIYNDVGMSAIGASRRAAFMGPEQRAAVRAAFGGRGVEASLYDRATDAMGGSQEETFGRAALLMRMTPEALTGPAVQAATAFRGGRMGVSRLAETVAAAAPNAGLRQDLLWALTEQIEVARRKAGDYGLTEKTFIDQNARMITMLAGGVGQEMAQYGIPFMQKAVSGIVEGATAPGIGNLVQVQRLLGTNDFSMQALRQTQINLQNPNWIYENLPRMFENFQKLPGVEEGNLAEIIQSALGGTPIGAAFSTLHRSRPEIRQEIMRGMREISLNPDKRPEDLTSDPEVQKALKDWRTMTPESAAAQLTTSINAVSLTIGKTLDSTDKVIDKAGEVIVGAGKYLASSGRAAADALYEVAEFLGIATKPTTRSRAGKGGLLTPEESRIGGTKNPGLASRAQNILRFSTVSPETFEQTYQALIQTESLGGKVLTGDQGTTFGPGHMKPETASELLGRKVTKEELLDPVLGPLVTRAAWSKVLDKHKGVIRHARLEWQGGPKAAEVYKETGLFRNELLEKGTALYERNLARSSTSPGSQTETIGSVSQGSSTGTLTKVINNNIYIPKQENVPVDPTHSGELTQNVFNG